MGTNARRAERELLADVQEIRELEIRGYDDLVEPAAIRASKGLKKVNRAQLPKVLKTLSRTAPDLSIVA